LAELVIAAYLAFFIVVGVFLDGGTMALALVAVYWVGLLPLVISALYLVGYRRMKTGYCVVIIAALVAAFLALGSFFLPFWEGPGFSYSVSVAYRGSWRVDYRGYQGTGGFEHPTANSTWGTFSGRGPETKTVFIPGGSNGVSICVSATKLDTLGSNLTLSLEGLTNTTSLTNIPVTLCASTIE